MLNTVKSAIGGKNTFIALILLVFVSVSAYPQSNLFGSIGGGISAPMGSFASGYNAGYNISGNLGMKVHKLVGLRLDAQYNSFGSSSSYADGRFKLITVTVDGMIVNFNNMRGSSGFNAYGTAGAGMYFTSTPDFNLGSLGTVSSTSKSYFGIGLGAGAVYKMSKNMGLFGELKYSFTLGGDVFNYVPIKVGVIFTP